jgi:hypothetical protein
MDRLHHALDIARRGDICLNRESATPELLDGANDGESFLSRSDIVYGDVASGACERDGRRASDASRGAGYESGLSDEWQC